MEFSLAFVVTEVDRKMLIPAPSLPLHPASSKRTLLPGEGGRGGGRKRTTNVSHRGVGVLSAALICFPKWKEIEFSDVRMFILFFEQKSTFFWDENQKVKDICMRQSIFLYEAQKWYFSCM